MSLPTVELRPWRSEDIPALVVAWHDPDIVSGSQPPADRSSEAAGRWIGGSGERERRLLAIDRVIDVDGECVGEVGVSSIDQRRGAALIGWWIAAGHRRRGYATAGLELMVDLLFSEFRLGAIVAEIDDDNAVSRRTALTVGFVPLGPGSYVLRRRDDASNSSVISDR